MTSIKVTSISSLEELEASLVEFSSEVKEAIEATQREIQRKTELIDNIVSDRRRAVAECQSACYETNDEEDPGANNRKLAEAEAALGEARMWQRRVEDACAEYRRHVSRASYLADEHTGKARLFLRTRIGQLYDYVEFKPDLSNRETNAGSAVASLGSAITSLPLPKGFNWVSLDQLMPAEMQDLPAENDYRKDGLSLADVREGLRLLQTRIMPEIQKDPGAATVDHFAALDAAEMRSGANSLANIYSAYFGRNDHIWVSRQHGDPFFSIGNGRHRIRAARDLGWNAVPGRMEEGRSKDGS